MTGVSVDFFLDYATHNFHWGFKVNIFCHVGYSVKILN